MKDEGREEEGWRVAEEAQDLRRRTKHFSLRVIRLFSTLPSTAPAQVIGKQALRSATSVGANYREACRSRSDQEFVAKLGGCLKELDETLYWLELIAEADIVPASKLASLQSEADELLAIFTAISKSQKRKLYGFA